MKTYTLLFTLSFLFLAPTAAHAQDASGEPPSLFSGVDEASPQALSAVSQKRLETLKQDAPTQSIRLVRIVDNLSQQRTLVMQMRSQALAPDVYPVFERTRSTEEDTEDQGNGVTTLFIQRDRINAIEGVTYSWAGTVKADPGDRSKIGEVILVHGEDRQISGTIRVKGDYYLIRPLSGGLHALVEEDESKYRSMGSSPRNAGGASSEASHSGASQSNGSEASRSSEASESTTQSSGSPSTSVKQTCAASAAPLFPKGEDKGTSAPKTQSSAMDPCWESAADVLVVYTSAAASGRNIDNLINLAVQEANNAYSNSDIDISWTLPGSVHLNLAHSQQVSFNESGDIESDLNSLIADGTVQSLRNQHNADVVVLITDDVYPDAAGIAKEIRAEAGDAYAIIEAPSATGGEFGFAHEVGHLQGAQHNPLAACHPDNPSVPYPACDDEGDHFADAFGHLFNASGNYRTVMAYDQLPGYSKILYFSNPDVTYNGGSTGTSSRNNADALQATAVTVENFRTSDRLEAHFSKEIEDPDGGVRHFDANPCGGTGTYSYEWRISYNGPFNYGPPVSTQETFTKVFPEGTHYVKLTVTSGSQTAVATKTVVVNCEPGHQCAGGPGIASVKETESSKQGIASSKQEKMKAHPKQGVVLYAPAPNPVRTSTKIRFDLPERTYVELVMYDLMGRAVKGLATGSYGAGTYWIRLDVSSLSSGIYLVRLQAGNKQMIRRITVVK